jgi:hypothetical protein
MIKKTELRIGNYYLGASRGGYEIVTGRTIQQIEESKLNALPIPLTPEVLEKCGFIVDELGYSYVGINGISLCQTKANSVFPCWKDTKIGSKPIKYLHQLQNLYFTLTGEELEIKSE